MFAVVDRGVDDAQLARLAAHIRLQLGLFPVMVSPAAGVDHLPAARAAVTERVRLTAEVIENAWADDAAARRTQLTVAVLACRCGSMLDLDDTHRARHRVRDHGRSPSEISAIVCRRCAVAINRVPDGRR